MKIIEFKRAEFVWAEDFYDIIMKKLNLPDWFGKNADALWDMLTGYIELPCQFIFVGFSKNENKYNNEKIKSILNCFIDAQKQFPDKIIINFVD